MFAAVNMQSVTASNLPWTGDHFGTRNISLTRFMRMKLKLRYLKKNMKYLNVI